MILSDLKTHKGGGHYRAATVNDLVHVLLIEGGHVAIADKQMSVAMQHQWRLGVDDRGTYLIFRLDEEHD